nr:serine/threonine-protein kinase D6PKL2 [Tanacetum cinerariifolium]
VVAIEYLHMLDIVYRDLKPENVLVRSNGHIMLTDFDLSLKCDVTASTPAQGFLGPNNPTSTDHYTFDPPKVTSSPCIIPNCILPSVSCFNTRRVRSMSFVGTHEYLAPEIVSGEGHGSAVDWFTLDIFMFELFYGVTPFRGMDNKLTLGNIVARDLEFPKEPAIPPMAKYLISQLLAKDPARRLGSTMGASAIKHHSFFQGVNWALLRCANRRLYHHRLISVVATLCRMIAAVILWWITITMIWSCRMQGFTRCIEFLIMLSWAFV